MAHRLPSQGAYERLEPYAGKLARTVLRGERRSNALFLPDLECSSYPEAEPVFPVIWVDHSKSSSEANAPPWGDRLVIGD